MIGAHLLRSVVAVAAGGLALAGTAQAATITIDPAGFAYSYWIVDSSNTVVATGPGTQTPELSDGTYTARVVGNTINIGTFDVSGGEVTTTAAGLSGGTETLTFNNASVTFNANNYPHAYFLHWLQGPTTGNFTTPLPKGTTGWTLWGSGNMFADQVVNYDVDASGNVSVYNIASGAPYTASGSTLIFPAPSTIRAIPPASLAAYEGIHGWGIHWVAGYYGNDNFDERDLQLIPGSWQLISNNLPAGSWKVGSESGIFTIPGDIATTSWSQTLTWVVTADGTEHNFVFIPEPGALGLLGLAGVMLIRRRPQRQYT